MMTTSANRGTSFRRGLDLYTGVGYHMLRDILMRGWFVSFSLDLSLFFLRLWLPVSSLRIAWGEPIIRESIRWYCLIDFHHANLRYMPDSLLLPQLYMLPIIPLSAKSNHAVG